MHYAFRILFVLLLGPHLPAFANDEDYFHRSKGDERVLDLITTLPDGTQRKDTLHTTATEFVEKDGHTYLREKWEARRSAEVRRILYRTDKDGEYVIMETIPGDKEHKTVVFPLKLGNQWKFTVGEQVNTVSIVGYETVTIDTTTYPDCLHLHLEGSNGYRYDSWSDQMSGFVKSTSSNSKGETTAITLKEFKPGK